MKIGYMIVGCIFLFNPFINIIDIFPDFIGYLFIMRAIAELSDLERNIRNARARFKAAMWVSLVKCALVVASRIFDSTWYLILTFSFGILESMYLIPAFIDLFYGISYLEERYTDHKSRFEALPRFGGIFDKTELESGRAYFEVFAQNPRDPNPAFAEEKVYFADRYATVALREAGFASRVKKKTAYFYESTEARTLSVIFLIVRAACNIIPELTAIAETGSGYVESNPIEDFSALRWLLILVLAVFALVVGILWLVRMIRYFNVFRKDEDFLRVLRNKYEAEVAPNHGLWTKRKTLSFCALATAAYAFLMCVRIDWFLFAPVFEGGFHIAIYDLPGFFPIPEFGFGIVMIFAAFSAKELAQRRRELVRSAVFFTAASAVSTVPMLLISRYYGNILFPYQETWYLILFAAYLVCFAVSMFALTRISREKRTVYRKIAAEIAEIACPHVHDFSDRRRQTLIEEFELKIKKLYILEHIYAGFSVAMALGMPFAGDYDIFGLFWFFRLIFGIVLIVQSLMLTDALQKEIEKIVE
ncbi:MAG: hypothetical protein IJD59_09700 [Clostridia bacterium]|nr:hypothetical protein [Clostridia bacterium]